MIVHILKACAWLLSSSQAHKTLVSLFRRLYKFVQIQRCTSLYNFYHFMISDKPAIIPIVSYCDLNIPLGVTAWLGSKAFLLSGKSWNGDDPKRNILRNENSVERFKWVQLCGSLFCLFNSHGDKITSLRFTPNGIFLWSVEEKGIHKTWSVESNYKFIRKGVCPANWWDVFMKLTFVLRYCVLFWNLFLGSLFLRPEIKVALFYARVNEIIVSRGNCLWNSANFKGLNNGAEQTRYATLAVHKLIWFKMAFSTDDLFLLY